MSNEARSTAPREERATATMQRRTAMTLAIQRCADCSTKVVPMLDGACPACRKRSFPPQVGRAPAIVKASVVPKAASEEVGTAERRSGCNRSAGAAKSRWLAARPLLCAISGVVCLGMAAAWYPQWYGIVCIGGKGGTEVSAEKCAEALDYLAQHGYGELGTYADQARKDAEREKQQRSFCWLLGVVGAVLLLYGFGDAVGRRVRTWRH